jgi:hypothetical protein
MTKSSKQSPSGEYESCTVFLEVLRYVRNLQVHYHVHKSSSLDCSEPNESIPHPYSLFYYNPFFVILQSTPKPSECFLPIKFYDDSFIFICHRWVTPNPFNSISRVLTVVHNTQNHWVSGPCPSSGSMFLSPPEDGNRSSSETLCFLIFRISDDWQSPEFQWFWPFNSP